MVGPLPPTLVDTPDRLLWNKLGSFDSALAAIQAELASHELPEDFDDTHIGGACWPAAMVSTLQRELPGWASCVSATCWSAARTAADSNCSGSA